MGASLPLPQDFTITVGEAGLGNGANVAVGYGGANNHSNNYVKACSGVRHDYGISIASLGGLDYELL